MIVSTFFQNLDLDSIVSEQDTRTKIAIPLLNFLGYSYDLLANEFPIYGYEGRKALYPKPIDILLFSSSGFENNRSRDKRDWVMAHSLLAVELKKPSESIDDAQGQAQFYSHWSRCPYYMCTNGVELAIYRLTMNTSDELLCRCHINEISKKWDIIYSAIAFNNIKKTKQSEGIKDRLIYEKYCESKLNTNYDKLWNWDQDITQCKDGKDITVSDMKVMFNENRLLILLAGAGLGKTSTILSFYNDFLHDYLNLKTSVIPIFLYAKYWKKTFCSIEEGILNELDSFISGITLDVIKNGLLEKKYIIFIDGLDECLEHRETLLQSINKLSEIKNIQIMASCRTEKYHNELKKFEAFELKGLSDQNLITIGSELLNQSVSGVIYSIGDNLKDTLKIPLFFSMWLNFCLDKGKPTIPKNLTILYDHFITRTIIDGAINKGNYAGDLLPIKLLKSALSKFAYSTIIEQSEMTLPEIMIETPLIRDKLDTSLTVLYQSGLILNFEGIIDFRQYSMKEYFCALEISTKLKREIIDFVEKNHERAEYKEIILHLLGIVDDEIIQEDILNFLEVNNLPFYVQCLKRRFNFSDSKYKNLDRSNSEKLLNQIAQSYEIIIDRYFTKLKKYLAPWRTIDDSSPNKVFILKGNLDLNTLDLSIILSSDYMRNVRTDFSFDTSKPSAFIERDGKNIPIPIRALTNNYDLFYYNINELYEGFDCAREIAIDMIKSGIKNIFKEKLLLFEEPPYMQLSYVEESLKKLPIGYNDRKTGRPVQFSLANNDIAMLLNFFTHVPKLEQYESRDHEYNALITGGVVAGLEDLNLNPDFILPPKIDRPLVSGHVSNLYTVDSIKIWVKNNTLIRQNSYRMFIEIFLPSIKEYIPEYISGPYKYEVILAGVDITKNGFNEHAGILIYPFPVETDSVEVKVRAVAGKNDSSDSEERAQAAMEEYRRLGRPEKYYTESRSSLWYEIREENSVRKRIYDKVLKNILTLLDGK